MRSRRRPRLVTWFSLGVLTVSLGCFTRLALGLRLPELPLTVPPWYLPLTGGCFGLVWLLVAYGLFTGRAWGPRAARIAALSFAAWWWIDRLLLAPTEYARQTRPMALVATVLGLAGSWWCLSRPQLRRYFEETSE